MSKTSIHISSANSSSEAHNFRWKELDYLDPEKTKENESYSEESIHDRQESIKAKYLESTGQKMQAKASPIREGVVVIQKDTTMQQLKDFAKRCQEKFGIRAFQIHIHRDEGYKNAKEWTPNLHAHIVFDWTDSKTGKTIKMKRQDFAEMQTILADCLHMERGQSSDKKHLTAIQFKNEAEKQRLQTTLSELSAIQDDLENAKEELKSLNSTKDIKKVVSKGSERLMDLLGVSVNDKEKETLKIENEALKEENERLNKVVSEQRNEISHKQETINMKNRIIGKRDSEILNYKKEIEKLPNFLTPQQLQKIVATGVFPMLSNFMAMSNEGSCL